MDDDIDRAEERARIAVEARVSQIRANTELKGAPGECEYCGDDAPRILNGACVACRRRLNLP